MFGYLLITLIMALTLLIIVVPLTWVPSAKFDPLVSGFASVAFILIFAVSIYYVVAGTIEAGYARSDFEVELSTCGRFHHIAVFKRYLEASETVDVDAFDDFAARRDLIHLAFAQGHWLPGLSLSNTNSSK